MGPVDCPKEDPRSEMSLFSNLACDCLPVEEDVGVCDVGGQAVGGEGEQCVAIALGVQRHNIATARALHHMT